MKHGLLIVAAALLLAYLAVGSLMAARGVEHDLVDRAKASMRLAGLNSVQVSAQGRDIVLAGEIASDSARDRARALAMELNGVQRVMDQMVSGGLAHIRMPPRLDLSIAEGTVVLKGDLPNEDIRGQIATFAEAFFPGRSVDNQIRVLDDIDDPRWVNALPFLVRLIGEDVVEPHFVVEEGRASLDGTVADSETLHRVRQNMTDMLAALDVAVHLAGPDVSTDESALAEQEPEVGETAQPEASVPGEGSSEPHASATSPPADVAGDPTVGELVAIEDMDAAGPPPEEVAALQPTVREAVGRIDPLAAFELQDAIDELMLGKVISFGTGSSDIVADSEPVINEVVDLLLERGLPDGYHVEVQGHTDSQGQRANNLTLSEERAEAVIERLVEMGIPRERLRAAGYADSFPIADNDTAEGRAMNRRIQFVIAEDG